MKYFSLGRLTIRLPGPCPDHVRHNFTLSPRINVLCYGAVKLNLIFDNLYFYLIVLITYKQMNFDYHFDIRKKQRCVP